MGHHTNVTGDITAAHNWQCLTQHLNAKVPAKRIPGPPTWLQENKNCITSGYTFTRFSSKMPPCCLCNNVVTILPYASIVTKFSSIFNHLLPQLLQMHATKQQQMNDNGYSQIVISSKHLNDFLKGT